MIEVALNADKKSNLHWYLLEKAKAKGNAAKSRVYDKTVTNRP